MLLKNFSRTNQPTTFGLDKKNKSSKPKPKKLKIFFLFVQKILHLQIEILLHEMRNGRTIVNHLLPQVLLVFSKGKNLEDSELFSGSSDLLRFNSNNVETNGLGKGSVIK
jgi:hypothetical protein